MAIIKSPVFIICCLLFILHQVLQKVFSVSLPLANQYLDSLLAMPIILSFLLLEKQILYRKGNNYRLSLLEVLMTTLFISFVTEWLFPVLSNRFTSDWKDIILYIIGSILFYFSINRKAKATYK